MPSPVQYFPDVRGIWVPAPTFATPGDLSVVISGSAVGRYMQRGKAVRAWWAFTTSTFTHTTASGDAQITGLPFTAANITGLAFTGVLGSWRGITLACDDICANIEPGSAIINLLASVSAGAGQTVTTAEMPTGGTVVSRGSVEFLID